MITAIVSGGMDSTVLAYEYAGEGLLGRMVSFDYGQRHKRELEFAMRTALVLDVEHLVLKLPTSAWAKSRSALVSTVDEVPDGHYADPAMIATIVPNRNMVMLSIAAAVAIAAGDDGVATAVHAGDAAVYPDCRPEFIEAMTHALRLGNQSTTSESFGVLAPYVRSTKAEIALWGDALGVPWEDTWTCYKGGPVHCGACGTCFERRESFVLAGVHDPTVYEATPEYEAPEEIDQADAWPPNHQ